jgi:hypothetical protein
MARSAVVALIVLAVGWSCSGGGATADAGNVIDGASLDAPVGGLAGAAGGSFVATCDPTKPSGRSCT